MSERVRDSDSDSDRDASSTNHPAADETPDSKADYAKRAQNFERAPEDFEADVSADDLKVPEHPVIVEPEGYGEASAYLASWGIVEDLQAEQGGGARMTARRVAQILKNHYVSPSFDDLDADDVRSMHFDAPDAFLGAIMPGMDASMNSDGSATIEQSESGK